MLRGQGILAGNLHVSDKPGVDDLVSLTPLHCLGSVEGYVMLMAPSLQSLAGLENLRTIGGGIGLVPYSDENDEEIFNEVLVSLAGLERLTNVRGVFVIRGHSALRNLDGLTGLRTIDGELTISQNATLVSLRGLGGLETIRESLSVVDNPSLPTCEAFWLRDSVGSGTIPSVTIQGNDDAGVCP